MTFVGSLRLVIRLGPHCFTLEFQENSIVSREGLISLQAYKPDAQETQEYPLADLNITTQVLFGWIVNKFDDWVEYNVCARNCHHFLRDFLKFVRSKGCVSNETDEFKEIVDLKILQRTAYTTILFAVAVYN
ncbi:hypothetical protein BGX23_011307 [Mortierella sp. AD031]|nr:hypothetical protein BGX23_011307 [Mortierella sp. AD031]